MCGYDNIILDTDKLHTVSLGRKYQRIPLPPLKTNSANYAIQYTVTWQGDSEKTRRSSRSAATLPIRVFD